MLEYQQHSGNDPAVGVARRLLDAEREGRACAPVRDLLPAGDIDAAYRAQARNREVALSEGRRLVGWKVGLTNLAVQRQLGVAQPDSGALFADMEVGDALPVPRGRLLQPKVEVEVAFVLGGDLDGSVVTSADVLRNTAFVLPAIEIVDSRIAGWEIGIVDTVADNASSGLYVLGGSPRLLTDVDLRAMTMTLVSRGEIVAAGSGGDCLGHPVNAVVWLANRQLSLGSPLRAGDLVLSGALGAMVAVQPGTTYEASIDGLGTVRADFTEGF